MEHVADEEMVKNAVGDGAEYDALAEPPNVEAPRDHPLWGDIQKGLRDIYDPEIPVNIYELGLIYLVDVQDISGGKDGDSESDGATESGGAKMYDIHVKMSLTSPGCPVAQEMPGWVQAELFAIDGVGQVDVEVIWDPTWDPSFMAETAKLQLNMFT